MSYATNKLAAHPEALRRLREDRTGTLITVHLMPQNVCNHGCSFCSYRMPGNKNSAAFDDGVHIPPAKLELLVGDFVQMGVKGVEVTGGGEPLAYPDQELLWGLLRDGGFATALVTNGTLLRDFAPLIASTNLKWARVSIDAAEAATYARMRRCPERHFEMAWDAVRKLREAAPEAKIGVGFVLSNENVDEVYDFVVRASDSGADNVRLTVTYSDMHGSYFVDHRRVDRALTDASEAVENFDCERFRVHNLMPARWAEVRSPHQDYDFCPTQQLLCVVEGEGKVYTCCTFAGSKLGNQGVFWEHPGGFRGLWEEKQGWRRSLNPRTYCKVSCLYERRNLDMLDMMAAEHTEFI